MDGKISTAAEAQEKDALPRRHEVHADPNAQVSDVPAEITATPVEKKSPAEWAYERLILYIQNFEERKKDLLERHLKVSAEFLDAKNNF